MTRKQAYVALMEGIDHMQRIRTKAESKLDSLAMFDDEKACLADAVEALKQVTRLMERFPIN